MHISVSDLPVVSASIVIAEGAENIENTLIGAAIIGAAIAVTKLLDVWWTNRREDVKLKKEAAREDDVVYKENRRADKEQLFRLQEAFIKDLIVRIEVLEKDSKEKDFKMEQLRLNHEKCLEDHKRSMIVIDGLTQEITLMKNLKSL